MLLAALADDVSVVTENVFENRFMFAAELMRMGADVTLDDHHAIVRGVDHLEGAPVSSTDLRAGAALVLAGIVADGETSVHHLEHIDRGYEDYVGKLASLGARYRVACPRILSARGVHGTARQRRPLSASQTRRVSRRVNDSMIGSHVERGSSARGRHAAGADRPARVDFSDGRRSRRADRGMRGQVDVGADRAARATPITPGAAPGAATPRRFRPRGAAAR